MKLKRNEVRNTKKLTRGIGLSSIAVVVTGRGTEGDKFAAGVTGRELDFFHEKCEAKAAIIGVSAVDFGSELRSELLSPSAVMPFLLKLKALKKLPGDKTPLLEA